MKIGSLFAGIGGLEKGLEMAGLGHVVWQVEINPYCRAVLAKHWPDVERHDDVKTFHPVAGSADLVCGGFPCQPWSVAGKRRGPDDERHLWPEFARVIDEARPAWVVGENVPGLRGRGLRIVLADLAARGFDAEWTDIRAADVGAPHRRERLFIVASHPGRVGRRLESGWLSRALRAGAALVAEHGESGSVADTDDAGCPQQRRACADEAQDPALECGRHVVADADGQGQLRAGRSEGGKGGRWACNSRGPLGTWALEPDVGRVAHGVPSRVDRLAALGNAVVPQVAEVIGRAIRSSIPP